MVAAALVADAAGHHGRPRFFEDESDGSGDVLDGFVGDVTTIAQSQCERWESYADIETLICHLPINHLTFAAHDASAPYARPYPMAVHVRASLLKELVTWAHLRWTIEQFHRDIKQVLGADEFQGRTWRGFHHHMAVVLLTQAFVAYQRLETGEEYAGFDSFERVAQRLVRMAAIQRLMEKHGFDRETAVDMLRGFSEWG